MHSTAHEHSLSVSGLALIVKLGSSARTEIGVRSSGDAHFQIETSLIRFLLLTDKKESTFASLLTPTLKYFDHF